jgi:hypothetical protein
MKVMMVPSMALQNRSKSLFERFRVLLTILWLSVTFCPALAHYMIHLRDFGLWRQQIAHGHDDSCMRTS